MCRRIVSDLPRPIGAWCLLAALCVSLCGCGGERGGKPKKGWATEKIIAQGLLSNIDPETAENFAGFFVEGKAPESQRERYKKYTYHAEPGDVVLDGSGNSATLTVQFQDFDGNPVGEPVQWEVVKKDNDWKLKSAPLPAAAK